MSSTQRRFARFAQRGRRVLLAFAGCVLAVVTWPAHATDDELPGRVGRIANVQGALFHAPDDSAGEWAEIGLNYPIAQGDNLRVERDGRAEVDYGGGQFRLAGETNLHVSRLDDRQLALFIAAGRVIVRVRVLEPDDSVRIDTPATQVALTRPGLYRIDVATDSPHTTVIVREGEAEIATLSGAIQLLPGQTASVSGVVHEQADVRNGGGIDGFDAWSASRDRVYEEPRQHAYVSRQMIGHADLDRYGSWETFPDVGAVWFPASVVPEWAPYRFGHWTWLSGWGYTWVDDAPWGYAPFHYGRWAHIGGRWGWCPGAYVARPLWAPALVAWYGGARWSHTVQGGPVYGWVPLGIREPFVPWWDRCNDRCRNRHNRPHGINVAEHRDLPPTRYANWSVPGGLTAMPAAALAGGKPVAINRVPAGSTVAFTPSLLARSPAIKPLAPVRPAARAAADAPLPASRLHRALAPVAPALPDRRNPSVAPRVGASPTMVPPSVIGVAPPARGMPAASPAATGVAPPARGLPAASPPATGVAPPARGLPTASPPGTRAATVTPPLAPVERASRFPAPPMVAPRAEARAPQAPRPAVSTAPVAPVALPALRIPAAAPPAVMPVSPSPRAVPAPAASPALPAPAVVERAPARAAPPARPAARQNP